MNHIEWMIENKGLSRDEACKALILWNSYDDLSIDKAIECLQHHNGDVNDAIKAVLRDIEERTDSSEEDESGDRESNKVGDREALFLSVWRDAG